MSGITDKAGLSDDALVKTAQQGDMASFEELVARHRDKIYARAFSMVRKEEEALDLAAYLLSGGDPQHEAFQKKE